MTDTEISEVTINVCCRRERHLPINT
jgi:hypothetical protein